MCLDFFFHFIGAFDAALAGVGPRAGLGCRCDSLGVFVIYIAVAFTAAADSFAANAAATVVPSTHVWADLLASFDLA